MCAPRAPARACTAGNAEEPRYTRAMRRLALVVFVAGSSLVLAASQGCSSSGGAGPSVDGGEADTGPIDVKIGKFPGYLPGTAWHADADGDGVPSARDTCPNLYDPAQSDSDGDGVGDVCDDDFVRPTPGGPIVDLAAEHVTPFSAWLTFRSTQTDTQGYGTDVRVAWSTRRADLESAAAFQGIAAAQVLTAKVRAWPGARVEVPFIVEGLPPGATVYLSARNDGDRGPAGNILAIRTPEAPRIAAATDRPTVLLRRADLDAFVARAKGGDAAIAAWKTRIDADLARIASPDETQAQYCASAALLYHATGEASRLTQAKALHARVQRAWSSATLTGNDYRWANAMLGICTDLLWNELSASERSAAIGAMLQDDEHNAFRAPPLFSDTDESDGATRTLVLDGLLACNAPGIDAALAARGCAILEAGVRRAYGLALVEARRDRGAYALSGGHLADGSDYGPKTSRYWAQLLRALQVNGAAAGDYAPFVSNLVRSQFVHGLTPARRGFINWGDVTSASNNLETEPFSFAIEPERQDALHLFAGVLEAAGDTTGALRARRALGIFDPAVTELSYPNLFFAKAAPTGENDEENAWFDSGMGILYDRTGWSANDSLLVAKATWGGVDHQQEDAGEVRLWRKGQWVLHPSVGYGGVAGQAAAHSVLPLTVVAEGDQPREGQYVTQPSEPPRITAAWSDGAVSVVEFALRGAYASYYYVPSYYANVRRSLVWWKSAANDELLVFDRVDDAAGAPAEKRWQLHFPVRPVVSGASATVGLGATSVRVDALAPAATALGVRAPVSTAQDSQEDVYTHRLVGAASGPSPRFLVALQAGEGSLAAARAGQASGATCALVGSRLTVFAEAGTGTCNAPGEVIDVVVAGLPAGARVALTLTGRELGWSTSPSSSSAFAVSEAGHVRAQVREGRLAEVTRDAVVP